MNKLQINIDDNTYFVEVYDSSTKVYDAWKLADNHERRFLIAIARVKDTNAFADRSVSSIVSELKAHKALYKRNYKVERTKDADIEHKQKFFYRIAYFFINLFLKED